MEHTLELPELDVPALLRAAHLSPKKGLGQNFLLDPVALKRIITAAEIPENSSVLEIGAGLGNLTRYLAQAAQKVVAVELDAELFPILQQVLANDQNVTLVKGDILKLQPAALVSQEGYLVVANIPYYITSNLIRHLLEASIKPQRLVLTVQREVAERICAKPGDLSLLALSVQVYGLPKLAGQIPAGAFYPSPKVDSTIVRVDLYPQPLIPAQSLDRFFRLAKAGYSQKRKTLRNALSGGLGVPTARVVELLQAAGIDPQRRAETISLAEWSDLTASAVDISPAAARPE
ncbi:MAG: 16S rRNA (adenine(1518)-N(6)/adenine(1519)-N(6))-dimethyltransferase RsmA [Anaerolineaceae bacterium]|nr:16S rRNA (adenine(1518)-N(6)/adenine(1519)-N(6))-dimethyltransferase RsmA [Anaerolineaceae bacterium]